MTLLLEPTQQNVLDSTISLEAEQQRREGVLDKFEDRYLLEAPVRTLKATGEAASYDHLDFFGKVHYDEANSHHDCLIMVRESTSLVKASRERVASRPIYGLSEVDPQSYLVATTDGDETTEWLITDASWKLKRGKVPGVWPGPDDYRRVKFDELVLELESAFDLDEKGNPKQAQLWLSRAGGTFKLAEDSDSGWLIGEGQYENGPNFLDDPVAALPL